MKKNTFLSLFVFLYISTIMTEDRKVDPTKKTINSMSHLISIINRAPGGDVLSKKERTSLKKRLPRGSGGIGLQVLQPTDFNRKNLCKERKGRMKQKAEEKLRQELECYYNQIILVFQQVKSESFVKAFDIHDEYQLVNTFKQANDPYKFPYVLANRNEQVVDYIVQKIKI